MSDKQIRERERKLRADDFQPSENIESLIDELKHVFADYHEGMTLDNVQLEWEDIRPKLNQIFHEDRVLPEIIVEKIPTNE